MKHPLVSIIIPTYNRAYLLEKSLRSVLIQSYEHIEVIVVDDCSSDNTTEVVKSLGGEDRRIKLVRNKMRFGLPKSRNIGLLYARGDLVFFSEDDLILSRDAIEVLVNTYLKLSRKLRIGAISPRIVLLSKSRSYMQLYECKCIIGLLNALTGEPCYCYNITSNRVIPAQHLPATSLIPKRVFGDIGTYYTGYKLNYVREESDLYLRMLKKGYVLMYQPRAIAFHVTGFRGGCTVENIFMNILADIHNQLIYLIRGYGIKAVYMVMAYILKKLLKLKYLTNPKRASEVLTIVEKIGYRRALNEILNKIDNILRSTNILYCRHANTIRGT